MKIGFDGKRATQNFTGLGNYSRYVLKVLAEYHPENQYVVFVPAPVQKPLSILECPSIQFQYPKNQLFKNFWRSRGIVKDLKKEKIDIFHGLSNEIPISLKKVGIPSVVTIHDLIFYRYPQYYPYFDRKIYELKVHYASKHANKIIAVSEQTKSDLINFFNVEESRIEVIYQNCDPIFRSEVTEHEKTRIRHTYKLPEEFLLNVGTIETRKNSLLIVKALKKLKDTIHLVIIGKETPYAQVVKDFITNNNLKSRVHFLKNVSFHDLPGIYQQASIFIYPSEFEGFGIPVVEALSSGIPVIAAKGSCLEEAGGKNSIYVDANNSEELADQINLVMNNTEKRELMIRSGIEHISNFSNQKIADKLFNLYQNLI
jgi:glycosyltransferase involved in cell wall biosynthesis|uniref:glycosyltransferase family 4 protein n=1 Tax=Daejeonella sp. TaxID=2805397 RepID=UPI00404B079E